MNTVFKRLVFGIFIGCTIFAVIGLIFDITNSGNFSLTNWAYTKMVLGSMLIGIGFSAPTFVYDNEKLHYAVKVMIHLGIGCTVMLAVSFGVGWIPVAAGWKICAMVIGGYLLCAILIWLVLSHYFKREAEKINAKILQEKNKS